MKSRNLYLGVIVFVSALLFASCDSLIGTADSVDENRGNSNNNNSGEVAFEISPQEDCEPQVFTLWAGQTIESGTVTVTNDDEYLHVTFETSGDWLLTETQLHVAEEMSGIPTNNPGNPIPGQFEYKTEHDFVSSYTYKILLSDLEADEEDPMLVVATHAVVVKLDGDGNITQSETGWGGDLEGPTGNRWWFYGTYALQYDCEDDNGDNGDVCFAEDTAWSDGPRYQNPGNWATYTVVDGEDTTVTLFAGQTNDIGTVSFEHDGDGHVTITINFADGAGLQDDEESVKIQGYNEAPSGNPSPGGFTTYKGTDTEVTVDEYKYYGVHIDSKREVACD